MKLFALNLTVFCVGALFVADISMVTKKQVQKVIAKAFNYRMPVHCTCKRVAWWFQFFVPVVIAIPFLFDVVTLDSSKPKASPALGVTIITALWWILEPIPIVITAFFPVFLLPLFNISTAAKVASAMFSDTSMD